MGANYNNMHLRLVAAIQDTQADGTQITVATQDGKKRTSAQRSNDLMAARYWSWSIFRIASKQLFFTETAKLSITGTGEGLVNLTALNITTPKDITVRDASVLFTKPITVVEGDQLPFYRAALQTNKSTEIVAALKSDPTGASQKMQLVIVLGSALDQDLTLYDFRLGYFNNPALEELTAASSGDITEPRLWWDAIERYAEYLSLKNSGNFERASHARDEAVDIILTVIEIEHGELARTRAASVLRKQAA